MRNKFKKSKLRKTDFLLPNNDFIVGIGTVLNITGNYFKYNYSKSPLEADWKAIESDWMNVGQDIKVAKEQFEKKYSSELCLNP